jgi:hypothetical protein
VQKATYNLSHTAEVWYLDSGMCEVKLLFRRAVIAARDPCAATRRLHKADCFRCESAEFRNFTDGHDGFTAPMQHLEDKVEYSLQS